MDNKPSINETNRDDQKRDSDYSSIMVETMSELLGEEDLLDAMRYFLEFEDAGGEVSDNTDDESDFNIEDDTESVSKPENSEDQNDNDISSKTSDDEDEEFSIDEDNQNEKGSQEKENQEDLENDEDENFDLPEDEDTDIENSEDEDFSMDNEDSSNSENDSDVNISSEDDSESTNNINPKLKELESVVFDDLTDEEKKIKIKDLKELYITIYKKCGSISQLLTDIKKDEETIQIVEYISNTLIDLKHYVDDYLNDIFDSKTYVENLAQLQKYIMIFNAISKVFDQIKQENE